MTDIDKNRNNLTERIRSLANEVIEGSPLFVVDVNVRGRTGSQVVEVFIESDESLGVDDLARISRELGFLIDAEEIINGRYSLNVSSPGVTRPLVLPRQYKKNVGRLLQVKFRPSETEEIKKITGELKSADAHSISLSTAGDGTISIPYSNILEAKVKLPW